MIELRETAARLPRITASLDQRINGYVTALEWWRRGLENTHLIYRDQTRVYPMQIEVITAKIEEIRRAVLACRSYLQQLAPQETKDLQPYACILKLGSFDYLLTELLLNLTMHLEVCAIVNQERVQLHMSIRSALPACLTSYEDTLAMLKALARKATRLGRENRLKGRA